MSKVNKSIFCILVGVVILFFTDVVCSASVRITDYPKNIQPGQTIKFKIKWSNIPLSKDLKLVAQLENKNINPDIFITKEIVNFKSSGTTEIILDIPKDITLASNYRFVAAFISRTEGWDNVFVMASTLKHVKVYSPYKVEIIKYPTVVYRDMGIFITISWRNIPLNKGYKLIVQLEKKAWGIEVLASKEVHAPNCNDRRTIKWHIPADTKLGTNYRFTAAAISKEKEWDDVLVTDSTEYNVRVKKFPRRR